LSRALLVVDMLRDFIEEEGALCIGDSSSIREKVAQRVEQCRSQGEPIIYIVDRHLPHDAEFNMFPPHCLEGQWGGEIIPEITPQEKDYVIPKRRFSAFFGTDLDLTLRELGIQEVELAGVCTQICVLYTAADARMLNYDVVVRKECVDSFDPEAHAFALKEMETTLGVKVL